MASRILNLSLENSFSFLNFFTEANRIFCSQDFWQDSRLLRGKCEDHRSANNSWSRCCSKLNLFLEDVMDRVTFFLVLLQPLSTGLYLHQVTQSQIVSHKKTLHKLLGNNQRMESVWWELAGLPVIWSEHQLWCPTDCKEEHPLLRWTTVHIIQ